jgi:hypothetical protein
MKSILSMSLDIVDGVVEGNFEKISQITEPLSDDAKTAYIPSLEEQGLMADSSCALRLFHPHSGVLNKYAHNTKEITEINVAYLLDSMDSLPEEVVKTAAANLICACNHYKLTVPKSLEKYASSKYIDNLIDIRDIDEVSYLDKIASNADQFYALEQEKTYPLNTQADVEKAAEYFDVYEDKFPLAKKYEFALNTKKAVDRLSMELDDSSAIKCASLVSDVFNEDFYNHVQVRKGYLKDHEDDQELVDAYDSLIKSADEHGPTKTASLLYDIDKKANLLSNYGHGIEDAVISTLAEKSPDLSTIDGQTISKTALFKLASTKDINKNLTDLVGTETIAELKGDEGLAVLQSLPKPIRQEILERLE